MVTGALESRWHSNSSPRQAIGIGIGIVVERFEIGEDQAFGYLRRVSSTTNTKVHTVAAHLVQHANARTEHEPLERSARQRIDTEDLVDEPRVPAFAGRLQRSRFRNRRPHRQGAGVGPDDETMPVEVTEQSADGFEVKVGVDSDVDISNWYHLITPALGRDLVGVEVRLSGRPELERGLVDNVLFGERLSHVRVRTQWAVAHPRHLQSFRRGRRACALIGAGSGARRNASAGVRGRDQECRFLAQGTCRPDDLRARRCAAR